MRYLLPLLFILVSCGDDDMKKYSKLEGLRILAIEADTPQINAAGAVNLTPYLSYPEANDTTLDISYTACIDPGIAYGAALKCDTPIASGTPTFPTSGLSANFYTGPMNAISITVPASAFTYLGTLSSEIQFNGIDVIVIIEISDPANISQKIKTFKRINITTKATGDLNGNPTAGDILSDASAFSSFPTKIVGLSLDNPSNPETYQIEASSGLTNLTESMTVTWFSNVGEFKFSRTDKDESVEFDPKSATSGVFVAVYRDNRGGVVIKRITQ
jgi:hypothetical protein